MNDRELLELAAKAAGIGITGWNFGGSGKACTISTGGEWSPLTDSGDALELAVKLRLLWDEMEAFDLYFDNKAEDRIAATRRAIVSAAAEIGRNME